MCIRSRILLLSTLALVLVALPGCNTFSRQPRITSATINPAVLRPGESAVISLAVKDRHRIITRVEGVIVDAPDTTFALRDDGAAPDEKAGDNVWSMQVDVPFQAPPGEFKLEFTAYDKTGTPITVRTKESGVIPLKEALVVRIEYAEQ
ncbi:MAG: hypothetical protein BWX80_00021 [Candidatus Hydrogenedentes bacterium ADurb.Bin101]|jgi:hypothetical protein|nr:MAG: hypothetical protein BWX80_00021 [Candidatus Hydrogenedentes bacterium ADurb.Bin101]HOC68889.1 hypothetical protein [Candidatus Hydrogenedentota bacterium]